MRSVLAEPDPDGTYPTRLAAVQAERIDRWAGWRDSPRRALLEPLVVELVDARSPPEWRAGDVLDWLLDEARAGLALTGRGALSRALCVEVARRRPDWTWGKPPRSETDVANLHSLHAALRGSGLVRRRGRKLVATKRAAELTPGARRVRLLESLLGGDPFIATVAELTLAAFAQGAAEIRERVAEAIAADGWRTESGALPDYAVPSTMHDVRRVLLAIGAAEGDAFSRTDLKLTESGRAAVLCALRTTALHPPPPPPIPAPQPGPSLRPERIGTVIPPVPGGVPPHLDPADEDDRAELIRLAHPELAAAIEAGEAGVVIEGEIVNPRLMHQVVADRLLHDDPPEDWLVFKALLEHGVDAHEAQHAVGQRLVEEMVAEFGPPPAPDRARAPAVTGALATDARSSAQRAVATAAERRVLGLGRGHAL